MAKDKTGKAKEKREYIQNPLIHDEGVKCPHCGGRYGHRKAHKYPRGRQRMLCGTCEKPFVVWRDA